MSEIKVVVRDYEEKILEEFYATSVTKPELKLESYEVLTHIEGRTAFMAGPHKWSPAVIEGPKELGLSIRKNPSALVTVCLQEEDWEFHRVFLDAESTDTKFILRFGHVTRIPKKSEKAEHDGWDKVMDALFADLT
jgi:hypothetical protein